MYEGSEVRGGSLYYRFKKRERLSNTGFHRETPYACSADLKRFSAATWRKRFCTPTRFPAQNCKTLSGECVSPNPLTPTSVTWGLASCVYPQAPAKSATDSMAKKILRWYPQKNLFGRLSPSRRLVASRYNVCAGLGPPTYTQYPMAANICKGYYCKVSNL